MQYILALDQGTTSSRAIVFDAAGAILATSQHEFRSIERRFETSMDKSEAAQRLAGRTRAVERTKHWGGANE